MRSMSDPEFIRYLLAGRSPVAGQFNQASSVGPDATAFQPQIDGQLQAQAGRPIPQQSVPLPPQRPVQQKVQMPAAQPQQAPMSLAPPNPGPGMSFSGAKGPQWTDAQWQNYWNRSNPDGLMSYYPVQE